MASFKLLKLIVATAPRVVKLSTGSMAVLNVLNCVTFSGSFSMAATNYLRVLAESLSNFGVMSLHFDVKLLGRLGNKS